VALQFSKAINCLEREPGGGDACDRCISCKKIDNRLHPDILVLEPENQTIKVDQVRQMQRELAYRPYEGCRRVCIVTAADRMAPHMSNILLKTLEEPPLHTVIILLANHSRGVLPTIASRCRIVRFNPLPIPVVSRWLTETNAWSREEAHLMASLSEGSPGRALELREEIRQIPRVDLLKGWLGLRSLSFETMELWTESLPSERERLMSVLEVARTLLRDLVVVKTGNDPSRVIHSDLLQEMKQIASEWPLSALLDRIEGVHRTILAISPSEGTRMHDSPWKP